MTISPRVIPSLLILIHAFKVFFKSCLQRAQLGPVISEKLKAEKASIEKLVRDAEQQITSEFEVYRSLDVSVLVV